MCRSLSPGVTCVERPVAKARGHNLNSLKRVIQSSNVKSSAPMSITPHLFRRTSQAAPLALCDIKTYCGYKALQKTVISCLVTPDSRRGFSMLVAGVHLNCSIKKEDVSRCLRCTQKIVSSTLEIDELQHIQMTVSENLITTYEKTDWQV